MATRTVQLLVGQFIPGGTESIADATIDLVPTRSVNVGDSVVLPEPITGVLIGETVGLEVTTPGWAWHVLVHTSRSTYERWVLVEAGADGVLLRDLPVVDPKTLTIDSDPASAWSLALGQAQEASSTAVTAAGAATGAAGDAATDSAAAQEARTGAETARGGAETARGGAEQAKADAEAARTAVQALTFNGAALVTADLNAIVTPGIYRQATSSSATLERNYPAVGGAWIVEVYVADSTNGGSLIQRATRYWVAGWQEPYGVWQRSRRGANGWGSWRFVASQRVDKTAGLRISTWDDVDSRDQIIYSDTGWRDISSSLGNGWAGSVLVCRTGPIVTIRLGLDYTAATSTSAMPNGGPGPGFRPLAGSNVSLGIRRSDGATVWGQITSASAALLLATNATPLQAVTTEASWRTVDAWPTVLPGTPVGTIPNL